jgi:hypothetical protein
MCLPGRQFGVVELRLPVRFNRYFCVSLQAGSASYVLNTVQLSNCQSWSGYFVMCAAIAKALEIDQAKAGSLTPKPASQLRI